MFMRCKQLLLWNLRRWQGGKQQGLQSSERQFVANAVLIPATINTEKSRGNLKDCTQKSLKDRNKEEPS